MLGRPALRALLIACALLGTGAPAALAADPATDPAVDYGGFHSVLGVGEGQDVNAAQLGAYEASGQPPSSFVNQLHQYSDIEKASFTFTAQDLDAYYKNSSFGSLPGGQGSTESPEAGLTILRDAQFQVPRIYGQTRAEVMYGAGYATAEDRLFLMDVLRHMAEGRMTELLGPSAAAGDSAQLGVQDFSDAEYTQQIEDLPQTAGAAGTQTMMDIQDYVAGINAFIDQAKLDPTKLPAEYPALGLTPATWTEADTAAVAVFLIAQFTVSGGRQPADGDLLTLLQSEHGAQGGAQLFNDFRRLRDRETPTVADRSFPYDDPGPPSASAVALPAAGSVSKRNAIVSGPGAGPPATSAEPSWALQLARSARLGLPPRDSNAVLIAANHSVDGHPLASMGPQVGYYSPEIFLEYELHGGGIDTSGVAFPGAAPYTLIGHGRDFAWTGTTANAGNEDVFAERLCNPDGSTPSFASTHYLYRGQCVAFDQRDQTDQPPVSPTSPGPPPAAVVLRALRSVHGPVQSFARVGGVPVALTIANATNYHAAQSAVAFMLLNENAPTDASSFFSTMENFTGNENWFYVDDRDIAWIESGWFPRHARGSSRDFPIWGTGAYDWQGFDPSTHAYARLPDSDLPQEINPPEGYLVSWNNKEVADWPSPAGTWSFGPLQRVQELALPLQALLAAHPQIDLAQLTQITTQAATRDPRGQLLLPLLMKTIGPTDDPTLTPLLAALGKWQADGALRVDLTGSGYDQDPAGILLMDAWMPRLIRAVFEPALGSKALNAISQEVNPYAERPTDSGFFNGWFTYLDKDLRDLLAAQGRPAAARALLAHAARSRPAATRRRRAAGHRHLRAHRPRHLGFPGVTDPFSQVYCGAGSLSACRAVLISTLRQAAAAVTAAQGPDLSAWKVPTLCPVPSSGPPTCDENVPLTAGAVTTPPFPFQNRGTFHQAVEITGHRPR